MISTTIEITDKTIQKDSNPLGKNDGDLSCLNIDLIAVTNIVNKHRIINNVPTVILILLTVLL